MKIPNEILTKYKILVSEDWFPYGSEEYVYRQFLTNTDYEIIKGYESLLSEPLKFLTNLLALAKTLSEVSKYRAIARTEIEKLEKEQTNETDK